MGDLWRSQEMQLVQFYMQIEAAHDIVDELGRLGLVEFKDLNPHTNAFQRHFINEVKRADEMERKLRFFMKEIEVFNKMVTGTGRKILLPEADQDSPEFKSIDWNDLEVKLSELEKHIIERNTTDDSLNRNLIQLIEYQHVLQEDDSFFAQVDVESVSRSDDELMMPRGLGFLTGVILREKFAMFEKITFRATRGNIFMKYAEIQEEIEDPTEVGKYLKKNVFVIFFHGTEIEKKIKKICETMLVNLYPCPQSAQDRTKTLNTVKERLQDLQDVLAKGVEQKHSLLLSIGSSLNSWLLKVAHEKGIYHTMNKFNYDTGRKCLIAEGWLPQRDFEVVRACIDVANKNAGSTVGPVMNPITRPRAEPPTYFRTNKYTSAFQGIVDSYGIARYREINPAVFTIVTFPYEFGIMFGDVGHGFLLLLFAIALIYKERDWEGKKINEMIEMFYGGRYLIFLMALFAIYQGALYNEFFSLPMNFGSAWRWEYGAGFDNSTFHRADPAPSKAYVFGVDPVWKGATNELLYYNSVKMKMSIIIGVSQMTLGIFLHLLNAVHFRHKLDIFFEFLPRIVFLWCIFGYLCIMIIVKWTIDWPGRDIYNKQYRAFYNLNSTDPDPYRGTSKAPVLLNELIYMALLPPDDARNALYDGQFKLQLFLVVIAVLCIPVMMCAKPFFLYRQHKNSPKAVTVINDSPGTEELIHSDDHEEEEEEFNFSEIMVHQGLETIEFVLGSVSHTASYLRLWALSLAHSELATVFWDKVMFMLMRMAPTAGMPFIVTAILMFVAHSVWFFVTLLVMMFMEGLSAFLHALRLHWVEFQSKFYRGDGRVFQPFSYSNMNGMEE